MIKERKKLTDQERKKIYIAIKELIGEDRVDICEGTRLSYAGTAIAPKVPPDCVVLPGSVEDVQMIVRFAAKHLIPITPICSGSQEASTNPLFGGIVIDSMGMNRILEINEEAAYALIEPGVTIGQLAKEARKYGFRITVGSFPPGISVVGNYLLTNANTHRATSRDDIIAVEVVLADGTIVRTGSRAFGETYGTGWHSIYNSYPDLKYLFMDAYGTLGVVTKAAVRLYNLNESRPLIVAAFDEYSKSLEFMKRLTRSNLVQHVCTWHWVLYTTIDHLQTYKHGGTSDVFIYDPWEQPDDRPYNLVVPTMSGCREDMEGHLNAVSRIITEMGGKDYTEELREKFPGAHEFFLQHYCEHLPTTTFMGGYGEAKPMFPIVIVDPAKVAELENWALRFLRNSELRFGLSYYSHSLDQNRSVFIRFTPFIPFEASDEEVRAAKKTYREVMETAFSRYGAVPCRNTRREDYTDTGESTLNKMGGYGHLLRLIKKALDPNNILNPGFAVTFFGQEY